MSSSSKATQPPSNVHSSAPCCCANFLSNGCTKYTLLAVGILAASACYFYFEGTARVYTMSAAALPVALSALGFCLTKRAPPAKPPNWSSAPPVISVAVGPTLPPKADRRAPASAGTGSGARTAHPPQTPSTTAAGGASTSQQVAPHTPVPAATSVGNGGGATPAQLPQTPTGANTPRRYNVKTVPLDRIRRSDIGNAIIEALGKNTPGVQELIDPNRRIYCITFNETNNTSLSPIHLNLELVARNSDFRWQASSTQSERFNRLISADKTVSDIVAIIKGTHSTLKLVASLDELIQKDVLGRMIRNELSKGTPGLRDLSTLRGTPSYLLAIRDPILHTGREPGFRLELLPRYKNDECTELTWVYRLLVPAQRSDDLLGAHSVTCRSALKKLTDLISVIRGEHDNWKLMADDTNVSKFDCETIELFKQDNS